MMSDSDRFYKTIIVDCPNCRVRKVEHRYYYLIDSYSYLDDQKFFKLLYGEYSETQLCLLKSNSLSFDEQLVVEIICNNCFYKRLVILNDELNNVERTIYPILPDGEPLPDCISEDIRKDFDEARLIVNYSVRCAVGLLRICSEKLCNFIADKYITDENKKKRNKGTKKLKIKNRFDR